MEYSICKERKISVQFSKITWRLHIEMIKARSVMTHTCPAWEFVAETHLLKLLSLQNRVLHTTGNFSRHKCRKQAYIIQIHNSENVCNIGTENIRGLNLAAVMCRMSWV
jgi:hypothetical protein